MYVMTLNFPNLDKGEPVDIDGLGRFENGYEFDVTADQAEAFRIQNSTQDFEMDEEGFMTVTQVPGPTLLQTFKSHEYIDVRKMTDEELKALTPKAEGSDK